MAIVEEGLLGTKFRKLGMVVLKGTQVIMISPVEDIQEIANPFNN